MAVVKAWDGKFIVAGQKIRFNCKVWQADQVGLCGLNFLAGTPTGSPLPTLGDFCQQLGSLIDSPLSNLLGVNATILGYLANDVTLASGNGQGGAASSGTLGIVSSTTAAMQLAGMITTNTISTIQQERGRLYVPFVPVDAIDITGFPTSTYRSDLAAFATLLIAPITVTSGGGSIPLSPVIQSRDVLRTTFPITASFARGRFGGQHRRGNYGRMNAKIL